MEAKEFIWGYISLRKREILGVQQFSESWISDGQKDVCGFRKEALLLFFNS